MLHFILYVVIGLRTVLFPINFKYLSLITGQVQDMEIPYYLVFIIHHWFLFYFNLDPFIFQLQEGIIYIKAPCHKKHPLCSSNCINCPLHPF